MCGSTETSRQWRIKLRPDSAHAFPEQSSSLMFSWSSCLPNILWIVVELSYCLPSHLPSLFFRLLWSLCMLRYILVFNIIKQITGTIPGKFKTSKDSESPKTQVMRKNDKWCGLIIDHNPTSEDGPGPGMIINNIVFAFSKRGWLNGTPITYNQIKIFYKVIKEAINL